jgi:7,8-dihydroneopterin 2',3'-cyclic phosphate phosphodiesterase
MTTLNEVLKLADKIKNKDLKKRVVETLKHPSLFHKGLAKKYKTADLKEAPASIQFHHVYKEGLVEHTYSVTLLCMDFIEHMKKVYRIELDSDSLIAAALVHDIGKLWGEKKGEPGWEATDLTLDHTMLGTAELYARGFPERVLHIVASHFGPEGPTPPQTMEAVIFHAIDNLDAVIGTNRQENILQLLGLKK